MKIIYVPMAADIINSGHLNIIRKAKKYGKIVIGLFTDSAVAEYKSLPLINYEQRLEIIKNIKGISQIIKQETWDFTENLKKLKPHYVIHGDDWKKGIQKNMRKKVINTLRKWNGRLIEIPYSKKPQNSKIHEQVKNMYFNSESRVSRLKRLIDSKPIVRILESHNSLTGLIIENLKMIKSGKFLEFDGMWSSSLTDSAIRGKPDNQSVDYSTRISGLNEILDVTNKPLVFDADNGGRLEHLPYLIRGLERAGVSAVVLEDKIGLKKNSLFKNQIGVKQDSINNFSKKIKKANESKTSKDLLIVARIESLILGKSKIDAIKRAEAYSRAGADAILIHSKHKEPDEIFNFAKTFIKSKYYKPLVAVPSTYSKTYEKDLIKNGFKIVIYANHLLRAAYPAMLSAAKTILTKQRSYEVEKKISSIKDVINLI